jgi:hypothetical protein
MPLCNSLRCTNVSVLGAIVFINILTIFCIYIKPSNSAVMRSMSGNIYYYYKCYAPQQWKLSVCVSAIAHGCLLLRTTVLIAVTGFCSYEVEIGEFCVSSNKAVLCLSSPRTVALKHAALKPVR